MKYRRIPKQIDAVQWNGENVMEVLDFMNETEIPLTYNERNVRFSIPPHGAQLDHNLPKSAFKVFIPTLEGEQYAIMWDYILRGHTKEHGYHFWVNKPEYFEANNEKI